MSKPVYSIPGPIFRRRKKIKDIDSDKFNLIQKRY